MFGTSDRSIFFSLVYILGTRVVPLFFPFFGSLPIKEAERWKHWDMLYQNRRFRTRVAPCPSDISYVTLDLFFCTCSKILVLFLLRRIGSSSKLSIFTFKFYKNCDRVLNYSLQSYLHLYICLIYVLLYPSS